MYLLLFADEIEYEETTNNVGLESAEWRDDYSGSGNMNDSSVETNDTWTGSQVCWEYHISDVRNILFRRIFLRTMKKLQNFLQRESQTFRFCMQVSSFSFWVCYLFSALLLFSLVWFNWLENKSRHLGFLLRLLLDHHNKIIWKYDIKLWHQSVKTEDCTPPLISLIPSLTPKSQPRLKVKMQKSIFGLWLHLLVSLS